MAKVVAIDWDGTIVDSNQQLKEGAREAITTLRSKGWKVLIYSANKPEYIQKCLNEFGLPVDGIWEGNGKPAALWYIDDRGIRFTTWSEVMENFKHE